jgi:hypothetical protein
MEQEVRWLHNVLKLSAPNPFCHILFENIVQPIHPSSGLTSIQEIIDIAFQDAIVPGRANVTEKRLSLLQA